MGDNVLLTLMHGKARSWYANTTSTLLSSKLIQPCSCAEHAGWLWLLSGIRMTCNA